MTNTKRETMLLSRANLKALLEMPMLSLKFKVSLKNREEGFRDLRDSKDQNRLNRNLNPFLDSLMITRERASQVPDSLVIRVDLDSPMKNRKNRVVRNPRVDSISGNSEL